MPRKKTLEARLADLITDFGLDAVIQCMRFAEEMQRPRKPRRKSKVSRDASVVAAATPAVSAWNAAIDADDEDDTP